MAKILGEYIPCLVPKKTAGGVRYYWQPSAALTKAGWKAIALGMDLVAAITAAKARNAEIEAWRTGGAKPKEVKKFVERSTIGKMIEGYRDSDKFKSLAETTRSTYSSALNLIDEWAGDQSAAYVTPQRVRVLRDNLMKPGEDGAVQHHRAHTTLRVGRTLFAWAKKNIEGVVANPFEAFDLPAPAPRDQIWDHEDLDAFTAAANRMKMPNVALAIELAIYIGQRQADILKLQASQWREVQNLDPQLHDALAGSDGRVMGVYIRQGKTKRWVGIPVAGDMRARIETAIADNARRKVPSTSILVADNTGRAWPDRFKFADDFDQVRARAIAPTKEELEAGVQPHRALADLQFRDLRRTCVVRLGELGLEDQLISAITGHKLGSVKKILEVYMPRTTKMAARAVVARLGHSQGEAKQATQSSRRTQ